MLSHEFKNSHSDSKINWVTRVFWVPLNGFYINIYTKICKDGNGYLEQNEIKTVLLGLFDMLEVNNKSNCDLSALISKILQISIASFTTWL